MGLDMYLYAERYVSGHSFAPPDEQSMYRTVLATLDLADLASTETPHALVRVAVAYWRKANAIHGWFVRHVQDGKDDCGYHYVSSNKLRRLYETTTEALEEYEAGRPEVAGSLLSPQAGFFFGSTEVDDWYAQDLRLTVKQLKPLLDVSDRSVDFYYHSSW